MCLGIPGRVVATVRHLWIANAGVEHRGTALALA
jgi:hydrogenase maturation factor